MSMASPSQERTRSKVVAVFRQPEAAARAREAIVGIEGLDDGQVRVIGPRVHRGAGNSAPDGQHVAGDALPAHLIFPLAGALLAVVAWLVLFVTEIPMVVSTPVPSLVAMTLFGAVLGLIADATRSIRPHRPAPDPAHRLAASGARWALVVQPSSRAQFERVFRLLQATGVPVGYAP
ncbi:MAG: hypothetical protein ABI585_08005 [Betaproteobacteria bacterium]